MTPSSADEAGGSRVATRRGRRRQRRRARVRGLLLVVGAVAIGLGLGVLVVAIAPTAGIHPDELTGTEETPPAPEGTASAGVLITSDPGHEALAIHLLVHDQARETGTVLLVPSTTVVDVPGHGAFPLLDAHALGGAPLVAVSLANELGVGLDVVAPLDAGAWRELSGPVDAAQEPVATVLLDRAPGETELDALPRAGRLLGALLEQWSAAGPHGPDVVARATGLDADDAARLADLIGGLAQVQSDGGLTTIALPVVPLGDGRGEAYRPDEERIASVLADRLAAASPDAGALGRVRVQVLNGNGLPRIGQAVAERLAPGGFRVVLSGNADRFTHETTRIVAHGAAAEPAARRARELLGVGQVERAGTPQTVVDLTIVVGADFPPGS